MSARSRKQRCRGSNGTARRNGIKGAAVLLLFLASGLVNRSSESERTPTEFEKLVRESVCASPTVRVASVRDLRPADLRAKRCEWTSRDREVFKRATAILTTVVGRSDPLVQSLQATVEGKNPPLTILPLADLVEVGTPPRVARVDVLGGASPNIIHLSKYRTKTPIQLASILYYAFSETQSSRPLTREACAKQSIRLMTRQRELNQRILASIEASTLSPVEKSAARLEISLINDEISAQISLNERGQCPLLERFPK